MTPYAYTPDTLAELWGVSSATVRGLVRRKQLQAFRVGTQIRIKPEAVQEYEAKQCQNGDLNYIEENMPPSGQPMARQSASRSAPPIWARPASV